MSSEDGSVLAIKLKCRHKNSAIHSDSIKFCHFIAAIVFYLLLFSLPQSWSEWEMRASEQNIKCKLAPCSVLDRPNTIPSDSQLPEEQGSNVGISQCPRAWSVRALWWLFPLVSLQGIMACFFPLSWGKDPSKKVWGCRAELSARSSDPGVMSLLRLPLSDHRHQVRAENKGTRPEPADSPI